MKKEPKAPSKATKKKNFKELRKEAAKGEIRKVSIGKDPKKPRLSKMLGKQGPKKSMEELLDQVAFDEFLA